MAQKEALKVDRRQFFAGFAALLAALNVPGITAEALTEITEEIELVGGPLDFDSVQQVFLMLVSSLKRHGILVRRDTPLRELVWATAECIVLQHRSTKWMLDQLSPDWAGGINLTRIANTHDVFRGDETDDELRARLLEKLRHK